MKTMLVYPRLPELNDSHQAPLGVQYLGAVLEKEGLDVKISDLTFKGWEGYIKDLLTYCPDFIGISAYTPIASTSLKAVNIAKDILPNVKIIIGGPHSTVDSEILLKNDKIDFIVIGEGENVLPKIIRGEIKERLVKGKPIEDLDSLPFSARHLIDYSTYLKHTPFFEMMVSRGCPFNCIFCQPLQRKLFGSKVKMRSVDNVVKEIRQIISIYGVRTFWFEDDTFTWNQEWLEEFCRKVKMLKILWRCNTRVNVIDLHKLQIMKDSGCFFISYGVESGSQKILDFMRKEITIQQIKDAFRLTHKIGIFCTSFIIIGTPTETKEDLEMTVSLIKEIYPDNLQISFMTPLIGTDLERYCIDNDMMNIKKLDDYQYCFTEYPIKLEHLTADDLVFYKKKMKDAWHLVRNRNYKKYIKMILFETKIFKTLLNLRRH